MILKIGTSHQPASDLGYLLHKNPSRLHEQEFPFGKGYVVFPEATEERGEVLLVLDVDPIQLVRGGARYDQYVNDRPYVASSFLSSAMLGFFSTAMTGRSKERQDLAETKLPFDFEIPVVKVRGGEATVRALFEPLGIEVQVESLGSNYFRIRGSCVCELQDLLTQLYILIPVMDDGKHYFVDKNEIEKLLNRGMRWLPNHPQRELVSRRFLRHDRILIKEAIARLAEFDDDSEEDVEEVVTPVVERRRTLHDQRLERVAEVLVELGARSVVDLGCGEGKLLQHLIRNRQFQTILGMDVSVRSLEIAFRRLHLEDASDQLRDRIQLIHGSLMYRDRRIENFDAAAVVEVIEHLDEARLDSFEQVVFRYAKPKHLVLTTPNVEYNKVFESMEEGTMRHSDHRFEWSREQFKDWATRVADAYGYQVRIEGVGEEHPEYGAPSQMGVFSR